MKFDFIERDASLIDHGIVIGRTISGKILGIPYLDAQLRDIWNRKNMVIALTT